MDRLTSVEVTVPGGTGYEVTYGHDANGNLARREDSRTPGEAMDFTYDSQNRLTQVTRGPPGAGAVLGEYDYDSRGRRTRSRGSSRGDVEYYYDGITVVEERLTGDGSLLGHYRYGDRLMAMDAPGGREWYHQDSQRTTGTMTDATGSVVSTYRLNPWGELRGQTGSSTNRQIFTGHQHDTETGLIYMGARYYDPETGRFLTQDAVPGDPQNPPSLNRYLYVYGNPLAYADPDGNFPVFSHISDALSSFRSWQDGMVQQMQRDVDNGDANHVVAGGLAVLSGVANGIAGIGQAVVSVADAVVDSAAVLPLAAVDAVAGTDLSAGVIQRTRDRLDAGSAAVAGAREYWRENSMGQMAIDLDDSARSYGRAMASGNLAAISGTASAVTELAAGGSGTVRGAQRALSAVARGADALGDGARVARQLGVRGSMAAAARGSAGAIRGTAQSVATSARRISTEVADGARRMSSEATEFGRGFAEGWGHARRAQRGRANAGVPFALSAERAYYGIGRGLGRARGYARLRAHPYAHTLSRHGGSVTDQQLITRARTGVAPDGHVLTNNQGDTLLPPVSSAFHSDGLAIYAERRLRQGPLQDAIAANPGETRLTVSADLGVDLGRGYSRIGSARFQDRSGPLEFHPEMTHARGSFELDSATGKWNPVTVFPDL